MLTHQRRVELDPLHLAAPHLLPQEVAHPNRTEDFRSAIISSMVLTCSARCFFLLTPLLLTTQKGAQPGLPSHPSPDLAIIADKGLLGLAIPDEIGQDLMKNSANPYAVIIQVKPLDSRYIISGSPIVSASLFSA